MHEWAIEAREYARHETRRGRRHAYERLDPMHTALVVIDMVPFFLEANRVRAWNRRQHRALGGGVARRRWDRGVGGPETGPAGADRRRVLRS